MDETGRLRFGLSASFTERLLALKSARSKTEDTRVIDQLVDILNNATDYKADHVLAAVKAFTQLYGNEGVEALLYGKKASKAKGYYSESNQLIGLNIDQLDIADVNELINILSHENYHASNKGNNNSEEALANIHADRFAFEWNQANTAENRHTGGRKGITTEEWEADESNSDVIESGNQTTNSVNDQENALCGGLCIGLVIALITYTTVEGEGNPVEGVREIGRGNDTITKTAGPIISQGINALLDTLPPEHRDELLGALNYIAATSESALKGADNLTGNVTSEWWNGLTPETQDALKGLGIVVSIPTGVGAGTKVTVSLSEKTLELAKQAKKLVSKKDNKTNNNYSEAGDVDAETGHSNLAVNETGTPTSADNPGGRNPGDEFGGEGDFNGSESHPVGNSLFNGVAFRKDLKSHLKNFDGYPKKKNKNGDYVEKRTSVQGAHSRSEFMKLVKDPEHDVRIESEIDLGNGISEIRYSLPRFHGNGKKAGEYSHHAKVKDPKTVYDSSIISHEKILELAQKAAIKKFDEYSQKVLLTGGKDGRIYNSSAGGIDFRVYLKIDKRGSVYVDNVHPR